MIRTKADLDGGGGCLLVDDLDSDDDIWTPGKTVAEKLAAVEITKPTLTLTKPTITLDESGTKPTITLDESGKLTKPTITLDESGKPKTLLPPPAKFGKPGAATPRDDMSSTSSADSSVSPAPSKPKVLNASYTTGQPLQMTSGPNGTDVSLAPVPPPPTAKLKRPGSGFFARKGKEVVVPDDALKSAKMESHFAGIVDDPRSCKICGKGAIWLGANNMLVIKATSGVALSFAPGLLTLVQAVGPDQPATKFVHGEFVIDETSQLGTLLEVSGKISAEEAGSPFKKDDSPEKLHWHVGVRGLDNVAEWVQAIQAMQQKDS